MKIAVAAAEQNIDSRVDYRFGRCRYFVVIDTETMRYETIDNAGVLNPGCVGIGTSQLIANKGVDAVITGNCGPNTYKVLDAAGVKVFVGAEGTVREAVAAYKEGKLKVISQPNVTAGAGSNKKRRPDSIRLLLRRIDIRYLIPGCKAQKGAVSFKFLGFELALYWPHPGGSTLFSVKRGS